MNEQDHIEILDALATEILVDDHSASALRRVSACRAGITALKLQLAARSGQDVTKLEAPGQRFD